MKNKHKNIILISLITLSFCIAFWFIGFIFFTNSIFSAIEPKETLAAPKFTSQDEKNYINSLFNHNKDDFVEYTTYDSTQKFDVRLIALYLPQFHPFAENNNWHGKGFTEWFNSTKAKPLFTSHHQPKLPIDVGFYDLTHDDVMYRQIELAKNYGIGGFAFYYYWFSGKKLMDKPLNNFLNNKELDFPFCIHWANESWSKRWDGGGKELLIKQEFNRADFKPFAEDLFTYFKDKRYIRINNRPLFIVYRPAIFSQELFIEFTKYLRSYARQNNEEEPYIIATKQFNFWEDPKNWGLDAITDFDINNIPGLATKDIPLVADDLKVKIYDWKSYVEQEKIRRDYQYKTFKTIFPRWDNTPRKAYSGALIFDGSTPDIYGKWLQIALEETRLNLKNDERIIFINAWNEWAEGAILEPDTKYGYAYLDTTRKVLENKFTPKKRSSKKTGIAVLTGGRNRISEAMVMLNQGKGERLLISGVKPGISLNLLTARKDIKVESILPIDLGYTAKDTVGNAKEIKVWADKHQLEKIYIVSSFYHIPRVKQEIEKYIKDKQIEYISTPSDFVSRTWWKNFGSFKFLSIEYTKFLIVFIQYKVLGL